MKFGIEFHENGLPMRFIRYDKNELGQGTMLVWDEEGRLCARATYVDGCADGPDVQYHPDGRIRCIYVYKKDIQTEFHMYNYDDSGKLKSILKEYFDETTRKFTHSEEEHHASDDAGVGSS